MQKIIFFIIPFLFNANVYEYTLSAAQGGTINLSDYQGKKMLIVNTASNTQLASQYTQLEALYEKYKDSLVVIAVPSNDFGSEQNDDSTLYEHVTVDYGVTFPVAGKTVVAGDSTCELYQWIAHRALNGVMDNTISSDFQKFLIDGQGHLVGIFSASVDPMSKEMQDALAGVDAN